MSPLLAETEEDHIVPSRIGDTEDTGEDEVAEALRKRDAYIALAEELDTQMEVDIGDDAQPGDTGTRHSVNCL